MHELPHWGDFRSVAEILESAFTCIVGHKPHTRTMRLMGAQSPVPLTPPSTRLFPWSQRGEGEGRPRGRRGRHDQPRRVQPQGPGFDSGPDSLWMFKEQQFGFTISPKKKRKAKGVLGGSGGGVLACSLSYFSHVCLFVTPWTVDHHAPVSMGFSRQKHWSALPCPLPGDLPDPGMRVGSLPLVPPGKPHYGVGRDLSNR